ncbi:MAG: DUF6198 family protein [Ruminococcus flavefaciens]|nr:DUF6198 family protein [Ruminococcus flavefaciens]
MENKRTLANRLVCYFVGLFIMTIGIALSVKSDLGVSPVSSIPYTLTVCWGIEMGKATILFHCVLIVIQVLILRKNFKLKSLLQLPIGIVFGYFTTFCNSLVERMPSTDNYFIRICMILISVVLVAIGIFMYLPADIMPLAGEGVMQAVADTIKIEFAKVKIAFDITMVVISLAVCLIVPHTLGSVGVGTAISAILVGVVLGQIKKLWAKRTNPSTK